MLLGYQARLFEKGVVSHSAGSTRFTVKGIDLPTQLRNPLLNGSQLRHGCALAVQTSCCPNP